MKRKSEKIVLFFNSVGIFPLFTVFVFYLLVLRVYFWNGFELPYWKHPLKSEIPFYYHNHSILFLTFLSKYVAIPIAILLFVYFVYVGKVKLLQRNILIIVVMGFLLYGIMEYVDPFGFFDWWLD